MQKSFVEYFPLSKKKNIKGNRRMVREKVLQILLAYSQSETSLELLFEHIFFRSFNFDDKEYQPKNKLLTNEEVFELEADVPIIWSKSESDFGWLLIKTSLKNQQQIESLIDKFAKNWELERISPIDKMLIIMASTEFLEFDEIPQKVSINEAIDIAKKYSTEKSSIFVNGILDSIREEYNRQGLIKKSGRGLIDK